jgi:diguanylate cyclase (GGDEF)-like protein
MREASIHKAHTTAVLVLKRAADVFSTQIASYKKEVQVFAELPEIKNLFLSSSPQNSAKADYLLEQFQQTLGVSVCYLMDKDGKTVAASNRNEPDSFVGKNYSFRPYFQESKKGLPTVYPAFGVTSKQRGIFISHPVYINKSDEFPAGVAVFKINLEEMEQWLAYFDEGVVVLINQYQVVFATNQPAWLLKLLWEEPPDKNIKIADTKQFGTGPFQWIGMRKINNDLAVDKTGREYLVHRYEIDLIPGWELLYLHNLKTVSDNIYTPIFLTASYTLLILGVLIVLVVFGLYRKGLEDLAYRKKLEDRLQETAITDELTGLLNRRGFMTLAEKEIKILKRRGGEIFILYADLDKFKEINDRLGHSSGDKVLIDTGEVLRATFRESDIIGRLGGDEFAVLFINQGGEMTIEAVQERLNNHIDGKNQGRTQFQLALSVGIVLFDKEKHKTLDELLVDADKMMYAAKKSKKQFKKDS